MNVGLFVAKVMSLSSLSVDPLVAKVMMYSSLHFGSELCLLAVHVLRRSLPYVCVLTLWPMQTQHWHILHHYLGTVVTSLLHVALPLPDVASLLDWASYVALV